MKNCHLLLIIYFFVFACDSPSKPKSVYSNSASQEKPSQDLETNTDIGDEGKESDNNESPENEGDGDGEKSSLDLTVKFTDPTEELLSRLPTYTVNWESDADLLDSLSYESKICSDSYCSNSCTESIFSTNNSREVVLLESSALHVCVRILKTEEEETGIWNASPALNLDYGNLEISLDDKVDLILQNMNPGQVLGTLSFNTDMENYSFKLIEGSEYFLLSGEKNETITLNKSIAGQNLNDILNIKVQIDGIDDSELSIDFSVEPDLVDNNLIQNGNFDNGVNSWLVTNNENTFEVIDDNGNKYLQVTVNNENDRVSLSQTITLKANTSYMLSVRMSGVNLAAGSGPLVVDTNDVFDDFAQFTISSSQAWTDFPDGSPTGTFTTGAADVDIVIRLFQAPTFVGQALYASVRLIEL
ncbi:MAG: carbohydrate binding domain-containing protein [Oligoflexales bacterium]